MSRNPEIEAIHEARFDLETCAPHELSGARIKLERLVEQAPNTFRIEARRKRVIGRSL